MAADPPEEGAPEEGAPEGQAPSQGGKAPPARTNGATGEQGPDGNAQQPGKAADPAKADTAAPAGPPRETAAPREGGASREGGARGATRGLMRTTEAGRAAPTRPAPRSPANQDAPQPTPQPASQPARGAAPARSKPPARPAEPAARAATASTRSGGGTKGAGLPVPASPSSGAAAGGAGGNQLPVPVGAAPAGAGGAAVPATSPAQPAQPAKAAQPAPAKKKRAAAPPRQRVSRTAPLSIAAIHAAMAGHKEGHDPIRLAMKVVVRLASVIWLAGAVVVWMRLIGYESDLISPSWHSPDGPWISTSVAAAVMPVISVGLWLAASWGIALWFCALLAATVAFAVSPGSVPFGAPALTLNIITLAAVVGLGALRSWRNRDEYV